MHLEKNLKIFPFLEEYSFSHALDRYPKKVSTVCPCFVNSEGENVLIYKEAVIFGRLPRKRNLFYRSLWEEIIACLKKNYYIPESLVK